MFNEHPNLEVKYFPKRNNDLFDACQTPSPIVNTFTAGDWCLSGIHYLPFLKELYVTMYTMKRQWSDSPRLKWN